MVRIGEFDLDRKAAVVAAIGDDPVGTAKTAKHLGADILELRLDLLDITSLHDAKHIINAIRSGTNLPCIVTNRLQAEGGMWSGTEEDRIALLLGVLPLIDAVDIELCADERMRARVIRAARAAGKTVIVSSHDFTATPRVPEMKDILERSFKAGADIAKLAVMPCSMQDVLNLLQVTLDVNAPVCTISMGDKGKHTRIAAPCYGSVLTYGAVNSAVAPGQLRIDELKNALEMLL